MNATPDIADRGARILVVDDEPDNVQVLQIILEWEGFRIVTATSGEEALAGVARQAPDLVLLDIMMPGMDGFKVAATIRDNPATTSIPIMMITAMHDSSTRMRALSAGAQDVLTKPMERAELCARVKTLLGLKTGR